METTMVIIWAVVIAATLVVEFMTCDFVSLWFMVGGVIALILAAFGVDLDAQIIVFVLASGTLLACFRPIAKRLTVKKTIPTNAEAEIGRVIKLESDVVDGKAGAKFNGTYWSVHCDEELKKGERVKITAIEGNTFKVTKAEA